LPTEPREVEFVDRDDVSFDFEVCRNRFVFDVGKVLIDSQTILGAPEAQRSLEDVTRVVRLLNEALQVLLRNAPL